MSKDQTREERLAEQLRANLKRRKAQARALSARSEDTAPPPLPNPGEGG